MITTLRRAGFPALLALAAVGTAQAEYYGLMNGRSVATSRLPGSSVEAGAVFGDLYEADYQHFGVRFNYRASPELMLYGDLGQTEIEDSDGTAFGAGAYYVLDGFFAESDFAVKGSYHQVDVENDFGGEGEFSAIVVEAVISGRNGLGARGNVGWYANIGMHKFDFDDFGDDETELGFGGGIVVPNATGSGEFYAGIDLIDEMTFGAGYRYFLK